MTTRKLFIPAGTGKDSGEQDTCSKNSTLFTLLILVQGGISILQTIGYTVTQKISDRKHLGTYLEILVSFLEQKPLKRF
jgi:hypothetical protein